MKSLFRVFLPLIFSILLLPCHGAFGTETIRIFTVSELIESKQQYHNQVIRFQGEAIGQRLSITDFVWVNILDRQGNALGSFMPRNLSEKIIRYGTYKTKGDEVLLEGIYHSKCEEHGGDTDLHVQSLQILQKGYLRQPDQMNYYLVLGCILLAGLSFFLSYRKKKLSESEKA